MEEDMIVEGIRMVMNFETIEKLIEIYTNTDDSFGLEAVCDALESFEAYHSSIYAMEIRLKAFSAKNMDRDAYQDMVKSLDASRTRQHNAVLANVNMLNRMAEAEQLTPVYDGVVSEERPFRREVANAVLAYVEEIIKKRR